MLRTASLYVMLEDHVVSFEKGAMVAKKLNLNEGSVMDDDYACLVWSEQLEDTIVDIFKAIGKALDIYSDEPGQAYKQGFAEGEAKVLREWNESLRALSN
jgi:hypothetical protein